ncbi:MAG: hypothetical protein J1F35_06870 [Erysipelotrichales bacterium]|nr:hypothetical protein [Erysipelotrichales bacterium]
MKNRVRYLVFSIIVVCSVLIVSIPFWSFAGGSKLSVLFNARYDLPIAYKTGVYESLVISDDVDANKLVNPTEMIVKNRNGFNKSGKIFTLVEKRSSIPYEYLRVSINDEIYKLNELKVEEDENYYYFYLKDIEMEAYKEDKLDTRIWLSKDAKDVSSTSTLITNMVIM